MDNFEKLENKTSDLSRNEKAVLVEKSIQKKFHKQLLSKFLKAITDYEMIKPNDKIAVCMSGGKDSFLMAKLFQELKRFTKIPFDVEFLVMDPGYNSENRKMIEDNASLLEIPIKIFETQIFDSVVKIEKSPCYICARMRRGYLYSEAEKLGCNKIALGHHFDDVIETILMGMLFGGQIQTMMPKLKSTNFGSMELIRPMYLIRESDVEHWRDYNGLKFLRCACKFTEKNYGDNQKETESMRKFTKSLIAKLKTQNSQVENNIFKSVENVSLSTIIAYKDKQGVKHNFLSDYDKD